MSGGKGLRWPWIVGGGLALGGAWLLADKIHAEPNPDAAADRLGFIRQVRDWAHNLLTQYNWKWATVYTDPQGKGGTELPLDNTSAGRNFFAGTHRDQATAEIWYGLFYEINAALENASPQNAWDPYRDEARWQTFLQTVDKAKAAFTPTFLT